MTRTFGHDFSWVAGMGWQHVFCDKHSLLSFHLAAKQFPASHLLVPPCRSGSTQYAILKNSGIPEEEIPNFRDPLHWLRYFPPLAMRDIKAMGCGVDWRRSFITTDVNPYYDSFVRWQFNTLKKKGLVVKDKRFALVLRAWGLFYGQALYRSLKGS